MNRLPIEILRYILREATLVQGGSSYPDEVDELEQEKEALRRINDSMSIKCAISLVSPCWHTLGDEFLFEIIHISQQRVVRPLVGVLRRHDENAAPRGRWCRHLIINLRHYEIEWTHGQATLWGLVPSCPRLEDLRCFLYLSIHPLGPPHQSTRTLFPAPAVLLQTIASVQASRLRSLHFGEWVEISLDHATNLLSHLEDLELCQFDRLVDPSSFPREDFSSWYDHTKFNDDQYPLNEVEVQEYEQAISVARWPASGRPVNLPNLRIFKACTFFPDFGKWHVPSLRDVTFGLSHDYEWESESLAIMQRALIPHSSHITRLTCGSGVPALWNILAMLPHLEQLQFQLHDMETAGTPSESHVCLQSIVFRSQSHWFEGDLSVALTNIQDHILSLPKLKTITIEGNSRVAKQERLAERQPMFAELGVFLTVAYNVDLSW
ncbi:hypothetical protein CALCODRAFT_23130 [Calocera cornea HHB12733]|uniref:F-box domain-containing protein n=1 Tax=Calocera cornea HHB12733 TaxID=1353952 RepID=A0A165E5M8_9BASI|nr:hypothetical protein CALCODRAFT_23130 [Calocera cornea HHB12733]